MKSLGTGQLAETLKVARRQRGMSQSELGRRVGMAQSHISKIEHGVLDIRVSTLVELSRALGLEPVLVPQAVLPAIGALLGKIRAPVGATSPPPAYRLDEGDEDG